MCVTTISVNNLLLAVLFSVEKRAKHVSHTDWASVFNFGMDHILSRNIHSGGHLRAVRQFPSKLPLPQHAPLLIRLIIIHENSDRTLLLVVE